MNSHIATTRPYRPIAVGVLAAVFARGTAKNYGIRKSTDERLPRADILHAREGDASC